MNPGENLKDKSSTSLRWTQNMTFEFASNRTGELIFLTSQNPSVSFAITPNKIIIHTSSKLPKHHKNYI